MHGWRESWSSLRWLGTGESVFRWWWKAWTLFPCCFSSVAQNSPFAQVAYLRGFTLIPVNIFKDFFAVLPSKLYREPKQRLVTSLAGLSCSKDRRSHPSLRLWTTEMTVPGTLPWYKEKADSWHQVIRDLSDHLAGWNSTETANLGAGPLCSSSLCGHIHVSLLLTSYPSTVFVSLSRTDG